MGHEVDTKHAGILVVDDEPANVLLVRKVLTGAGYSNVLTTTDPSRTLDLVIGRKVDLVLLDLNMPHLDGFQVMTRLKSLENPPSVLVLTAQIALEQRLRGLEAGARDYVTKPFEIPELLARVRNLLEAHLLHVHLRDEKAFLETLVDARTRELHDSRLDIIRRLGRAAEFRDNETGLHIIRMSKYSKVLGLRAGMAESDAELLLQASPMHDIGKIGIPDHILLKPGQLTPQEWEIMQTHARIGADLLDDNSAPLLRMARDIALSHHEKWDGSGYPNGLAGEDIPLVGRIVAVADVFDALTSARPYKQAWPVAAAVDFLREQRDRHFQASLVDLFIEELEAVARIRDRHAEPRVAA
ncbi:MAG: response regulator [Sulfuricellaceae bacterium]|nr:response regulator [Sulfuricellaceae bacterium]